jgi:PiT family inorganic phosphate transporter
MITAGQEIALLAVALLFAYNLGAHYTGATMGMAYASGSVRLRWALLIVAVGSLVGAVVASGGVERTVGLHLVASAPAGGGSGGAASGEHGATPGGIGAPLAIAAVASAGVLTMAFNYLRLPTSTIQILVFCLIGAAVAAGGSVHWTTVVKLAVVWAAAPMIACLLGFAFTRALGALPAGAPARGRLAGLAAPALVLAGMGASFVMGANDVSNATGVLVLEHLFSTTAAGAIGGAGLFAGALTWGRPIIRRVAFDVVQMDLQMACAAQAVQALVVILAVSQGLFTSMNQALIAAMAGAGLARGRRTVRRSTLLAILRGWLIGPGAGFALAYAIAAAVR